jgi:hypothetical protein
MPCCGAGWYETSAAGPGTSASGGCSGDKAERGRCCLRATSSIFLRRLHVYRPDF